MMIKSVDGYDIPNALVQFASEKNKKKNQRLKFTSNLAFLQVSFFFYSKLIWEWKET